MVQYRVDSLTISSIAFARLQFSQFPSKIDLADAQMACRPALGLATISIICPGPSIARSVHAGTANSELNFYI